MGSKLSTGAFGTSRILRTTCKCSAMMLIFSGCSKLASASSRSRGRQTQHPSWGNVGSNGTASTVSWDEQCRRNEQINRCAQELIEEEAARRAEFEALLEAQCEHSEASDRSQSTTDEATATSSTGGDEKSNTDDEAPPLTESPAPRSPTAEPEAKSPGSVPEVPIYAQTPPAPLQTLEESNESSNAQPRQMDFSRISMFQEIIEEYKAHQDAGLDLEIEDDDLKQKMKTAITMAETDVVGCGGFGQTVAEKNKTYKFPIYPTLERLLYETEKREKENARRRRVREEALQRPPPTADNFTFDKEINWGGH